MQDSEFEKAIQNERKDTIEISLSSITANLKNEEVEKP